MFPAPPSNSRDRTADFHRLAQAVLASTGSNSSSSVGRPGSSPLAATGGSRASQDIEQARAFNRSARNISTKINLVTERITRLTSIVRARTSFGDAAAAEIARLTVGIKQDIFDSSKAIDVLSADLSALVAARRGSFARSKPGPAQAAQSSQQIVNDLKTRLVEQSKVFGDVLMARSQDLQDQTARRGAFESTEGGSGASEVRVRGLAQFGLLRQRLKEATAVEAAEAAGPEDETDADVESGLAGPRSRLLNARAQDPDSTDAEGRASARAALRLPQFAALLAGGGAGSLGGGSSGGSDDYPPEEGRGAATTLVERSGTQKNEYLASRAEALRTIQRTTSEIAGLMERLNLLVHMQGEMAMRIDENVAETEVNVEEGHNELTKYLDNLTSNQWLIIKVFAVVIIFAVLFVTVLA